MKFFLWFIYFLLLFWFPFSFPPIRFVSTESVPSDTASLSDAGGYAQSKWAAEQLVQACGRQHGLPVTIIRPGLLTWCEHTGAANPRDWLTRFWRGCLAMKLFPRTRAWLQVQGKRERERERDRAREPERERGQTKTKQIRIESESWGKNKGKRKSKQTRK